jgi:hypothetical protein
MPKPISTGATRITKRAIQQAIGLDHRASHVARLCTLAAYPASS